MTAEFLTSFFGWMAVINIAYLALGAVAVMGLQSWMISVHQHLFRLDENDLKLAYFNWLGTYKIMAVVFSIAPYIALKLM